MSALVAHQLTVSLRHKSICKQLDLNIAPGEMWGILGPNGAGKTTLLHTLAGLLSLQSGSIHLAGKNLYAYSAKQRAQLLGLLFQQSRPFFPQTVWEYALAGRYPHLLTFTEGTIDKHITRQALQTMDLEHVLDQNIMTLSGGEWRRLALATLIAQNPQIYLLDEPLNHLDPRRQTQVLRYFRQAVDEKKISVVMVLHDIPSAKQYCDNILMLLENGETRVGGKTVLLTETNLAALYGELG